MYWHICVCLCTPSTSLSVPHIGPLTCVHANMVVLSFSGIYSLMPILLVYVVCWSINLCLHQWSIGAKRSRAGYSSPPCSGHRLGAICGVLLALAFCWHVCLGFCPFMLPVQLSSSYCATHLVCHSTGPGFYWIHGSSMWHSGCLHLAVHLCHCVIPFHASSPHLWNMSPLTCIWAGEVIAPRGLGQTSIGCHAWVIAFCMPSYPAICTPLCLSPCPCHALVHQLAFGFMCHSIRTSVLHIALHHCLHCLTHPTPFPICMQHWSLD
jgi:hypothetical protein